MSIEQDYIDLFSMARKGHMSKYVYMYRPDIYERILNQESYYPFKMERDLLVQRSSYICKHFKNIGHVIEFGPGSCTPVLSKTVPFLHALKSHVGPPVYTAMDSTLEYAEQACFLVSKNIGDIKTHSLEIDFLSPNNSYHFRDHENIVGNKLMICFGQPIFANNNDADTGVLLKNINHILNKGDYILFGLDQNKDERLLKKAYDTKLGYELLLNTMYLLKSTFHLEDFDPEKFSHVYQWDDKQNKVELSLRSTARQYISIGKHNLAIEEGQVYNILNSKKPPLDAVEKFLTRENLMIREILSSNTTRENKFSIIIAQKDA